MQTPRIAAALLALCALAESCRTKQDDGAQRRVLARLVAQYPCAQTLPPIADSSSDTLSKDQRCALVGAALRAVASAAPGSGVDPQDTSVISGALLTPLSSADSLGRRLNAYWIVSFAMTGRPYDGEVWIDRKTGESSVHRTHKPLGRTNPG